MRQAAGRAYVSVADARLCQRGRRLVLPELRVAARLGGGPDVEHAFDAVLAQQFQEFFDRPLPSSLRLLDVRPYRRAPAVCAARQGSCHCGAVAFDAEGEIDSALGRGIDPKGNAMAAVNLRCVDNVDLDGIPVHHCDGHSH